MKGLPELFDSESLTEGSQAAESQNDRNQSSGHPGWVSMAGSANPVEPASDFAHDEPISRTNKVAPGSMAISSVFDEQDNVDSFEIDSVKEDEEKSELSSKGSALAFTGMFVALAGAIGVISYFGIGPMLAPPPDEIAYSSAPDVTEVMGLSDQQPLLDVNLSTEQKQAYLDQLSQLTQLPQSEKIEVLQLVEAPVASMGQFFAEAVAGDVLVMFQDAQQAYLLRPDDNKIIASGSVGVEDN